MGNDLGHAADALEPTPGLASSYVNAIRMNGGAYDIAIDLGQRVGDVEPIWERRVFMSWTHAAALHRLLGVLIAENGHGSGQPLGDPESALAETETAEK